MVAIREWLLDHAKNEFFSFDKADFDQESYEILEGCVESDDEDANRSNCWKLLQTWQHDREYLSSLNLHRIIARHVRNTCRKACTSSSIESWVALGLETSRLDGPQLANEIETAIRAAWKVRAPWRTDAAHKFSEELSFKSLDNFHLGLENIIGYPPTNSDYLDQMKREHEQGESFADQEGRNVDPKVEWNIVMRSEKQNINGAGCEPTFEIKKREIGKPLEFYFQKANGICTVNHKLIEAEVAALRLWTGPMHKKYAEVLRSPKKPSCPYVTTLHAINSGITKLARLWQLPCSRKVYRGYRNLSLKKLQKDEFQCVGGVDTSVLATSEDFEVAVHYSGDGSFILEMDVGQVNRGADVSWLSQFPHEREILFNALSNVEFVSSPQQRFVEGCGTILVYPVCLSANVKSKRLEEFVSLRKHLHLNLVDVLTQEARRIICLREEDSRHGLAKSLCAECRNQCDCILKEAGEADDGIFNEGAPAYLTLVEDAILFQARALQIIDLALNWLDTREVDPAKLDRLRDWQLEALRTAFKDGEGPQVMTIVLEQGRVVRSLFTAESLVLGTVHNPVTASRAAKLLTLNPNLNDLKMEVDFGTAADWEQIFEQLCPDRPRLRVNGFLLAEYADVTTLHQLELRNCDTPIAAMIAPALQFHTPSALTSLSMFGSPIGCTGAESLGRTVGNLQMLRYLDLRSCKIADRGCTGISHGLLALTALEDLNLAYNQMTDDGFNILANAIRTYGLSRLKSVDMRCNKTDLPSLRCEPQCIMRNHIVSELSTIGKFSCIAWNPGGNQFVTGSDDGTVIIWDASSFEQISTLKGHSNRVSSVSWRPDGDQFASGSNDTTIIIWDAKTGGQVSTLEGHTWNVSHCVTSVAWHPEGNQIASASLDKTIIIWDAKRSEQISTLNGHTESVTSVAWRTLGDQLASASVDRTIIIWHAKTRNQVSTLKGHTCDVTSIAWRPGGDQIASASHDKNIIIWDVKTGDQVSILKVHTDHVRDVAWNPDGTQIASASEDKKILIWDTRTRGKVSTLKGHKSEVMGVAWRKGGDQIASVSHDGKCIIWDAMTIFWDAVLSDQVSTLKGHKEGVTSVQWHPGGDQIASASCDKTVIIWDAKTGEKVSTLNGHTKGVTSVAWRPGGDQIASGSWDSTVIIWDAKTGKQISTLQGHKSDVTSVAWHPEGDRIASGSNDNTIIIWDAKNSVKTSTLMGHTSTVTSVAWCPRGDQIAMGSSDNTITIFEAKTGNQISTLKAHTDWVLSVAWRPGGNQIASASYDKTVIIWDAKTGEKVSTLKGHTEGFTCVAWRPGSDQIASGCTEKTITIFDAKKGVQVSTLKGHKNWVRDVAWNPDGTHVASASDDNTIIIWQAKT